MTLPLAMILQGAAATPPVGEGDAEAIDLDGTNDYLSRASDFTGNADGKTFTFSAWVWLDSAAGSTCIYGTSSSRISLMIEGTGAGTATDRRLYFVLNDTGGANVIFMTSAYGALQEKTWNHILMSCDAANTSNRAVYLNDVALSVTWNAYADAAIDFTMPNHYVGTYNAGTSKMDGRLAHVFLAYEYIDLSVEANRRIFITADRKPA